MDKIPVKYVGLQEGFPEQGIPNFYLVDEPGGSTKSFDPMLHYITGLSDNAKNAQRRIPDELESSCIRCWLCWMPCNQWEGDGVTCGNCGSDTDAIWCSEGCKDIEHEYEETKVRGIGTGDPVDGSET